MLSKLLTIPFGGTLLPPPSQFGFGHFSPGPLGSDYYSPKIQKAGAIKKRKKRVAQDKSPL